MKQSLLINGLPAGMMDGPASRLTGRDGETLHEVGPPRSCAASSGWCLSSLSRQRAACGPLGRPKTAVPHALVPWSSSSRRGSGLYSSSAARDATERRNRRDLFGSTLACGGAGRRSDGTGCHTRPAREEPADRRDQLRRALPDAAEVETARSRDRHTDAVGQGGSGVGTGGAAFQRPFAPGREQGIPYARPRFAGRVRKAGQTLVLLSPSGKPTHPR